MTGTIAALRDRRKSWAMPARPLTRGEFAELVDRLRGLIDNEEGELS